MGARQACRQHSDGEGQAQAAVQAEQPSLGVLEGDVGVGERAVEYLFRTRWSFLEPGVTQLHRLLRGRSWLAGKLQLALLAVPASVDLLLSVAGLCVLHLLPISVLCPSGKARTRYFSCVNSRHSALPWQGQTVEGPRRMAAKFDLWNSRCALQNRSFFRPKNASKS